MFRNVVAALNEALDITMHLKPLTEHFEVGDFFSIQQNIKLFKTRRWRGQTSLMCDRYSLP